MLAPLRRVNKNKKAVCRVSTPPARQYNKNKKAQPILPTLVMYRAEKASHFFIRQMPNAFGICRMQGWRAERKT